MARLIDLTGQRFERLLVTGRAETKRGRSGWSCQCDCGNEVVLEGSALRSGNTRSCGCMKRERLAEQKFVDLSGQRFGRLDVVRCVSRQRRSLWLCRCVCGNEITVPGYYLKSGDTSSCGCLRRELSAASIRARSTTHGMTDTPTYRSWRAMINRCTNPKTDDWHNYGGRGIQVCERWINSFENFLADMGERPAGKSIERVDNEWHYEPGNCVWATPIAQGRNRRTNVISLSTAARIREMRGRGVTGYRIAKQLGITQSIVSDVLHRKTWDPARA